MSEQTDPNPNQPQETEEQELCPQCLTGNPPHSHFCRRCGAPLSSYAATGPFDWSVEGRLYRRAAEQPRRFIVVLGIWMVFGCMALTGIVVAAVGWDGSELLSTLVGIGLVSISIAMIVKTTRNYRKRPKPQREEDG